MKAKSPFNLLAARFDRENVPNNVLAGGNSQGNPPPDLVERAAMRRATGRRGAGRCAGRRLGQDTQDPQDTQDGAC